MAELAVSGALVLIEIITPLLRELNGREGIHDSISSMKSWLTSMKSFMEDHFSGSEERRRLLLDLVDKLRDIAYDIEDVLDEFLLHSPPYTFHSHRFIRALHTYAHNAYHIFPRHRISRKIEGIRRAIADIESQRAVFSNGCVSPSSSSSSSSTNRVQHHLVSPLLLDDEMVGYQKEKDIFSHQLVDRENRLVKLAVVGPGGSGKTTFVKNVFWKQGIMGRFDCHAWVHVSQHFKAEELFINLLKQFCVSRKEQYPLDDGTNTQTKLHKYLVGKRFMVVLDDIWSESDWNGLKDGFPNSFCGSRIIITTRSSSVAAVCASSELHIHNLICLEWLQGLTLFYRKAFPDTNGQCPPELKGCSERIVKRCEGLPLAIVAVGAALSHRPKLPNEWEKFHNILGCDIIGDPTLSVISYALLRGYLDLSSNLKSCFLYFSIFPEDYSVERGRLIRLWVAEHFARGTDGKTAEEVAEGYLDELIQRNLVHVSNWDVDGRPINCLSSEPGPQLYHQQVQG